MSNNKKSNKVLLLMCGSFNPPTFMHLRMFEIAKDSLIKKNYEVIGGVLSPVHDGYGKKELVNSSHRVEMLKLALHSSTWIRVSDWECNQESWVRTREVLDYHQNTLNSSLKNNNKKRRRTENIDWIPDEFKTNNISDEIVTVKLLCGGDLLESFGTPGLWKPEDLEIIVGDHGLVVITREGSNPDKFIYESDMLTKHQNNIHVITEWIANEVSSTKIRRAIRRDESVKYLISDRIINYVKQHNLYKIPKTS